MYIYISELALAISCNIIERWTVPLKKQCKEWRISIEGRSCQKRGRRRSEDQRMQRCSREWIVKKYSERDLFDWKNTIARGWRFEREREREREREKYRERQREKVRISLIRYSIMRASLIVSLLMFARFRASFSSGHFSRIRVSGFAWLITINKYPASAWNTVPREKEITSCRGFCYNHGKTGGGLSHSNPPR